MAKSYLAGLGAGEGEGQAFLSPHPPHWAWAKGAVRVTRARKSPATAKRTDGVVVMGDSRGWFGWAPEQRAWNNSDPFGGVLFKEKFTK